MIATVDPSRSAPAGRASRIACSGAGSDGDAVCPPPDALHHQALGQQPAARHERGHGNDPPADQREPPRVIESAPEPKRLPTCLLAIQGVSAPIGAQTRCRFTLGGTTATEYDRCWLDHRE